MSRESGTTPTWAGSIIKKHYNRHRSCARVVVAIGVVLFALWNFSISSRVVPKNHQLKAETVMLDSYLADGESAAKSALAAMTLIAHREVSSSPSSATLVLPSKAYNETVHKKRVEEEHSDDSLSLSTNSSLLANNDTDYDKYGLPAWITRVSWAPNT